MYETKSVTAIIVAGGSSRRMGFDKLFYRIRSKEILWRACTIVEANKYVDDVVVVVSKENITRAKQLFTKYPRQKQLRFAVGGATRAASVKAGVAVATGDLVAIHDAARPFVSQSLISRVIEVAAQTGAAAPAVPVKDTIKISENGYVTQTPPRENLWAVQTPQVFERQEFSTALDNLPEDEYTRITDDCMVMERAGKAVKLVEGSYENRKITTPEDLDALEEGEKMKIRVGHGYDVHKFVNGRRLVLGGVDIPHEQGLLGHSDADVLLHAVADALLGAASLGDIGLHFPPEDEAYKDADSSQILCAVRDKIGKAGYVPLNVDATIICQAPRLAPYIEQMRQRIAEVLQIAPEDVSVKATTEEGLGFTGRSEGVAAHCVVLLRGE